MDERAIRIRQATPADIPLLTNIIRTSFADVAQRFGLTEKNAARQPSNCTDRWIEKDLARGVTYYILEHAGVPAGCAAMEQESDELFYLERLAVLPGFRRKGFGHALVNNVMLKAGTLHARELGIGIIAAHTELKKFYERIGFVERETRDFAHLPFRVSFMRYTL